MPATQYYAWERHFRRWPPQSVVLPELLATICVLICRAMGSTAKLSDFAPWMRTPQDEEAEREAVARQRVLMVQHAYQRSCDAGTG